MLWDADGAAGAGAAEGATEGSPGGIPDGVPGGGKEAKNLVFSPLSLTSVLSLLLLAARGTTYHQLRQALQYPAEARDTVGW